ncbi:MAG TPA: HAD hydrolase-like protein [Candidatus Paceibacterota bacterium]|nr:HAD hydrolase-like protein [Candidatus Paceibacterota bacterium]
MTIIFDFNRTLYDPDTGSLVHGALELLADLAGQGAVLHLVSRIEPGRTDILDALDVRNYFTTIAFVSDKTAPIRTILASATDDAYVVGDHLHDEVRAGNRYGAKTIWLKRGKFKHLMPLTEHDRPWRTATDMQEVRRALFS